MKKQLTNRLGSCPCCNKQIANPGSLYTGGILKGHYKTIKEWLPGVFLNVFISTLGTQIHLHMCESCTNNLTAANIRGLWAYVLEGMELEADGEYRQAVGAEALTEKQYKQQQDVIKKLRGQALVGMYWKQKV